MWRSEQTKKGMIIRCGSRYGRVRCQQEMLEEVAQPCRKIVYKPIIYTCLQYICDNICIDISPPSFNNISKIIYITEDLKFDTAYKRWSYHVGYNLLCKLCRNHPTPLMGARFLFLGQAGHADPKGWLTLILIKAGDVETNQGPTTTHKQAISPINKYTV